MTYAFPRQTFDFLSLDPKKHAIFLDHDGTVAPFVIDAKKAFAPKAFIETVSRLQQAGFMLAFISGRPIAAPRADAVGLETFYAPLQFPASGLHGFEFRAQAGGAIERPDIVPIGDEWWEKAEALAKKYGTELELKGSSNLVFHVRAIGNEAIEQAAIREFEEIFAPFLAANPDYKLQPGHKIRELCPDGAKGAKFDKGQAIARFMALPENAGKIPVFFGDDGARLENGTLKIGTDEYGFEEVLKHNGIAVLVGAEAQNKDCTSVAQYQVASPQDLWAGFEALADKFAPMADLKAMLGNRPAAAPVKENAFGTAAP